MHYLLVKHRDELELEGLKRTQQLKDWIGRMSFVPKFMLYL